MMPAAIAFESRPTPAQSGAYRSRMAEKLLGFLARREKPRVLDVGPVVGRNIDIILSLGARLSVCDIMRRLGPDSRYADAGHVLSHFDYQENSFDSIILWDIPDHLDNTVFAAVMRKCSALLRPGGLVAVLASNATAVQPFLHHLAFIDDCTVLLGQATGCRLPYFHRANRDLTMAVAPLEIHSSFVCMNGMREFLFRRVW